MYLRINIYYSTLKIIKEKILEDKRIQINKNKSIKI